MKQTVNINKLKGKIVENGMSIDQLAKRMGINRATLYRKLNSDGEALLISEANAIVTALNLSVDEAMAIFFSNFVA